MGVLLIAALVLWLPVALVVAVVLGRAVHLADVRSRTGHRLTTADLPAGFRAGAATAPR